MAAPRKAEKPEYFRYFHGLTPVFRCHARELTANIPSVPRASVCGAQDDEEERVINTYQDESTSPISQNALQRIIPPREEEGDKTATATDSKWTCNGGGEGGSVHRPSRALPEWTRLSGHVSSWKERGTIG